MSGSPAPAMSPRLHDHSPWLDHCEGFHVDDAEGRVGWIEELERSRSGRVSALLVRPHHVDTLLRLPVVTVREVEPEHGRVLITDTRPIRHRGRGTGWSEYRCHRCGYGATAARAPERCPMCGRRNWLTVSHPRREREL